jgi:hypothetical protein
MLAALIDTDKKLEDCFATLRTLQTSFALKGQSELIEHRPMRFTIASTASAREFESGRKR